MDPTTLDTLYQTITHDLSDGPWLTLLETVAITGVADSLHLRQATGLDRDRLNRLLEKLDRLAGKLPPILAELDHALPRLGTRGRAPTIYLLGETGAALLRRSDATRARDARACGLKEDTPSRTRWRCSMCIRPPRRLASPWSPIGNWTLARARRSAPITS